MAAVLVTDGDQRSALAAVRSLGRAGHTVFVCSTRTKSLAGASRHAREEAAVPSPLERPGPFVDALARLAARWAIDVVLPMTEPSILAVLESRDALAGVRIPVPDLERFRAICDKAAVLEAAGSLGIAVPAQHRLESPAERGDTGGLSFPLVVKPTRSVAGAEGQRIKVGVGHAYDARALDSVLRSLPRSAYPVLLQERIVGPGVGIFLLVWHGRTLAAFAHRRIREKPPSGGVSVYRESIALDPALLERSLDLLKAFDWEGVAMIEYKCDARTGTAYLMEINGRFWGSLQLAIDAGVDFPAMLVEAALDREPTPVDSYRTGARSRWWWGEVDHLLARLRAPAVTASVPGEPPAGRTRAVLDLVRSFAESSRNEVFRIGDPVPAVREILDWLRRR